MSKLLSDGAVKEMRSLYQGFSFEPVMEALLADRAERIRLAEEAAERERVLRKILRYTHHAPECEVTRGCVVPFKCTCGLSAALAAAGKEESNGNL